MAPIRRYLRISKYSVLECRIYVDNPADTRWLLDTRDPVLPRVFESIRPLVLPKLREENENARAKKKSKPVKDVLVEEDFEVSIFLRETGTRHSIATRHKSFKDMASVGNMPNEIENPPIRITDDGEQPPHIPIEVEDDDSIRLSDIPEAEDPSTRSEGNVSSPSKQNTSETEIGTVSDEKKLGMTSTYEGFNIWGWVLCLLVSRRNRSKLTRTADNSSNQALMEEWICTQTPLQYEEGFSLLDIHHLSAQSLSATAPKHFKAGFCGRKRWFYALKYDDSALTSADSSES